LRYGSERCGREEEKRGQLHVPELRQVGVNSLSVEVVHRLVTEIQRTHYDYEVWPQLDETETVKEYKGETNLLTTKSHLALSELGTFAARTTADQRECRRKGE
jgi:hypothetical protein